MRNMETIPCTTQLGISVARGGEGCFLELHISLTIDLKHDTRPSRLCTRFRIVGRDKSNVMWYFRGQKKRDKICECKKSQSTLFILSKRNDDSIVTQNVRFEFRQN